MTLRILYKRAFASKSSYLFISEAEDYNYFLTGTYKPLPPLPQESINKFLVHYNRLIQSYLRLNKKNKFFFATPFATRNTWQSSFYQGMESCARLAHVKKGDVHFTSPEWYLWAHESFDLYADPNDLKRARIDLKKIKFFRSYMAWQGFRNSLSRKVSATNPPHGIKFFIASVWPPSGVEKWNKTLDDPFHGPLPRLLQEGGYDTAVIYHAEWVTEKSDISQLIPAFNITSLISPVGWMWIFWILFTLRIKSPKSADFPEAAVIKDIGASLSNQLPLFLISYAAARRLLKSNRNAKFLTPYENNCWELGILQAAREIGKKVIGFQHTSFSPFFLKMDNRIDEKILPDKIFTSGAEPTRILTDLMGHDKNIVQPAGSLRYKFFPLPIQKNDKGKILVLLQGAPDDPLFLYFLSLHLKEKEVIIRSHPSWPIRTPLRFSISGDSMQTDMSKSRMAIYTGTTASFDILTAGIPVIHANIGSLLPSDPLINLNCCVKKTWNAHSTKSNLKDIISDLDSLSEQEKISGFKIANSYIQDYFSKQNNVVQKVINE